MQQWRLAYCSGSGEVHPFSSYRGLNAISAAVRTAFFENRSVCFGPGADINTIIKLLLSAKGFIVK